MSGGSRIVDLRGRARGEAPVVEPLFELDQVEVPPPSLLARVMAGASIVASLAWIAAMTMLALPELRVTGVVGIAAFVASLLIVPAAFGIGWIVFRHGARAEVRRFAGAARSMRAEAAALEFQFAALIDRVGENRAALQHQANALFAIGDTASLRLSTAGAGMEEQAASIERSTARLGIASDETVAKLDRLIVELPFAETRANGIGRTLDEVAVAAAARTEALDVQLVALAEHGRAARAVADGAAEALVARIAAVTTGTADAGVQIAAAEETIARINDRLAQQDAAARSMILDIEGATAEMGDRIDAVQVQATERNSLLAQSIAALDGSAHAMNETLAAGGTLAGGLIGTAEEALVAVDAVAREIDETLPAALQRLDAHIEASRSIVAASKPELLALVTAAQSTNDAIASIADLIADQTRRLQELSAGLEQNLAQSNERAAELNQTVDDTLARSEAFVRDAAPQLIEALLRVRETANSAADRAREALGVVIPEAANALEASATASLKRAAAVSVERQVAALGEAADIAVEVAQRASDRLTRQLMTIADTTAAVEARIDEANAERDTVEQESLSRRSSALIDSLNSAAIDLASALSTETPDTAWASYLKGDRGVFTRRAVRLLDTGEARDVAQLYGESAGFRDQVNRYVHDFEAMLRTVLAQRDGAPLGVTLLSSDMGKLYVVLAQAIDRLRA